MSAEELTRSDPNLNLSQEIVSNIYASLDRLPQKEREEIMLSLARQQTVQRSVNMQLMRKLVWMELD